MRIFIQISVFGCLVGVLAISGCGGGDSEEQPVSVDTPKGGKADSDGATQPADNGEPTTDLLNPQPLSDLSDIEQLNAEPRFLEARKLNDKYPDGKPRRNLVIHVYQNGPTLFHGEYKEWHPNGRIWKEGKYDNNQRIGEWKFYAENGNLAKHAYYAQGEPDRQWTFYRDDGTKSRVENWQTGKKQGEWLQFGNDGKQAILLQSYRDDLPHGPTVRWFPINNEGETPQKQLETRFVDGRQHGTAREWHRDGQLKRQIEFRNGKRHGIAKEWDADGRVVLDLQFRDGELVQAGN